jgi:hypothetical protein
MLGPCGEEEEDSEPDHCYATDVHGVPPSVGVSANPSHSLAASLLTKREDCQSNSALTGRNAMSEITNTARPDAAGFLALWDHVQLATARHQA